MALASNHFADTGLHKHLQQALSPSMALLNLMESIPWTPLAAEWECAAQAQVVGRFCTHIFALLGANMASDC